MRFKTFLLGHTHHTAPPWPYLPALAQQSLYLRHQFRLEAARQAEFEAMMQRVAND